MIHRRLAPVCRRGFTLLELVVALSLVAVLSGIALPRASGLLDRWAVGAARDAALGLVHRTRILARVHGGAELRIVPDSLLEVVVGDTVVVRLRTADEGVRVDPGGMDTVRLAWDALGVGRVASRTLLLRRGGAEAALVVSSTGRARRR